MAAFVDLTPIGAFYALLVYSRFIVLSGIPWYHSVKKSFEFIQNWQNLIENSLNSA